MGKKRKESKSENGIAFAGVRLKRLRQVDETWEADFRALPKPLMQNEPHYLGIVVAKRSGAVLAESRIERRPKTDDLAALLAQAMRRPLTGTAHRPRHLHVRGHLQWQELFPHLEELGISVAVRQELSKIKKAHEDYLRGLREARRATMVRPSPEQKAVEELFPTVAKWVRHHGHIEVGEDETFGFVVRALSYGNLIFEDDKAETLAEAMAALEKGLAEHFEQEGIE